jgi:ornithine carbamoyltransferase
MNIGLLSEEPDSPPAGFFIDAATELGASVAHVKPKFPAPTPTPQAMQVARLLGKLYDAVEWQIGFDELVPLVRSVAEVPVYKGLALAAHPVSSLADRLDPTLPAEQRRRRLVQAALLISLGKG